MVLAKWYSGFLCIMAPGGACKTEEATQANQRATVSNTKAKPGVEPNSNKETFTRFGSARNQFGRALAQSQECTTNLGMHLNESVEPHYHFENASEGIPARMER